MVALADPSRRLDPPAAAAVEPSAQLAAKKRKQRLQIISSAFLCIFAALVSLTMGKLKSPPPSPLAAGRSPSPSNGKTGQPCQLLDCLCAAHYLQ